MPEVSDCMDVPDLRGMSRKDIDENMRFIVPSDEWVTLGDGVMLTGYGLVDGKLHVQLLYEDIANTDNHGYVYLVKGEEDKIIEEGSYSWYDDEENSFQEYVFSIPADELADYQVWGEFWTCSAGAIDGEWSITFPLE
jgi:hypothetical protein